MTEHMPPTDPKDHAKTHDGNNVEPMTAEKTDTPASSTKKSNWLRAWYPLSLIGRVVFWLAVVLLVLVAAGYYVVGTPWGTRLIIQTVADRTGIRLKTGEGNLRDGLWIYDLHIPASPPKSNIQIDADKAYIKVGWRALLLHKNVHLREAHVGTLKITNLKPPNNQPFSYPTVNLTMNVILDDTTADLVRYQQVTREPMDFKQAKVKNFTWQGTQMTVESGAFAYNALLSIANLQGGMNFSGDYPINAHGDLVVNALSKAYFDTLHTKVTGSLKDLSADIQSRYNNADVTGHLRAHPMEDHAPFDAKLQWQDALLPYAKSQNIRLKNGTLIASGITSDIRLKLDTHLTAKDIPNGRYMGTGRIANKQLDIERLHMQLAEGELVSKGTVNWQDRTHISLINSGQGFAIRKLLPESVAPYAPHTLTGKLFFNFDAATDNQPRHYQLSLQQDDGEQINATIEQAVKPKSAQPQPYMIDANWRNVIRRDLPNIGDFNSPSGRAQVNYLDGNTLSAQGNAQIVKLNIAPAGDYQFAVKKRNEHIDIAQLNYQGGAGKLDGTGAITLARAGQPLAWQINATTNQFNAKRVIDSVPLQNLTGTLQANGTLRTIRQAQGARLSQHDIHIGRVNMAGDLLGAQNSKKHLVLAGAGQAKVDLAENRGKNDLEYLAVKFDGNLNAPNVPQGALNIDIAGTTKQIQINRFEHQGKDGGISARGKLDLTQGIGWQLTADMNRFDASYFVPHLPSQITGKINTDGFWRKDAQFVHISDMNLSGKLKNKPLIASGQLTARLHLPSDSKKFADTFKTGNSEQIANQTRRMVEQLNANHVQVQWGNNRLTANGDQNQLNAQVDVSTLHELVPSLKGQLKGSVIATQTAAQTMPNVLVDLVGRGIALPNFAVSDAKLVGKLVNLAKSPSQLQLDARGINIANQPLRALQLQFNGTQASHNISFKADSTRGQVQGLLKGQVDLDKKQWSGALGNAQIGSRYATLQQMQPAQMVLDWQKPRIELAAHCWQMVGKNGYLCFKNNLTASREQGQVNLAIQQIDSQALSVFMPKDIAWSGTLNGSALVNWQRGQHPTVNASLYSDNGVIGTSPQTPEDEATTIAYDRVSVIARSTAEGLKLRGDLKTSGSGGVGYLDATINPYQANKPIAGTLVFQDVNLAIFKPFFPSFERLTGNGLVAGKISGTLNQPKFVGDIEAQDAGLAITGVPMKFSNINLLAHIDGSRANLDGQFKAGEGTGNITGLIDWQKQLQAHIKLQGKNLSVSQPPTLAAQINPTFDVVVRPSQRYVNIVGAIDVPRAIIQMPEQSANVVNKSPDVNVIDRRLAAQVDEVLRVTQPWSINADIGVDLGNRVIFRGFGTSLPLAGALHLTQRGQGSMKAQGVVQVAKRSRADIFGQSLTINFAQVRFNGEVKNPGLNIEAVKTVQGTQVGVKVRGTASKPEITVFNDGGLTEQQAMNALVTGSINNTTGQNTTNQEFVNRVNNALAAAGLSYGLSSTRGLTNQIGRAFGLQSLTLDAVGTSSDTEVGLIGYITPDLYIRYGVGVFNANTALSMRYQLTRRLYVEAKAATNNSVDLIYNWRY